MDIHQVIIFVVECFDLRWQYTWGVGGGAQGIPAAVVTVFV